MKIRLFGLLHLKEEEHSPENFHAKNFQEQISVYTNNAINFSNSLRQNGVEFVLLTNKKNVVEQVVRSEGKELKVLEIPFPTNIPYGIRFFSAHFKIDAFRYLSSLKDEYVGLCDLDMVCINALPACFSNIIEKKTSMVYDISDQVIPAYGHDVIIRDLELIHHLKSEGRWSGGEFISGAPGFFVALISEIDKIYDNYLNVIGKLHHVGDEAIVSSALEIMRRNGVHIADAGSLGIVGRYWNTKTLHPQKSFEYFEKCFLLHLPADKAFLAGMARKGFSSAADFKKKYITYRKPKSILKKLIHRILVMASKC